MGVSIQTQAHGDHAERRRKGRRRPILRHQSLEAAPRRRHGRGQGSIRLSEAVTFPAWGGTHSGHPPAEAFMFFAQLRDDPP
jgi:hypothetical protein